nr:(2Fe-2S)-binding protein [Poseidonocella sedimentorum]
MIICHCTSITDKEIHAAVEWMRSADQDTIITPGKVYRVLGRKPDCGGCLKLFVDTMRQSSHLEVPLELQNLRGRTIQDGESHEGRRQGH